MHKYAIAFVLLAGCGGDAFQPADPAARGDAAPAASRAATTADDAGDDAAPAATAPTARVTDPQPEASTTPQPASTSTPPPPSPEASTSPPTSTPDAAPREASAADSGPTVTAVYCVKLLDCCSTLMSFSAQDWQTCLMVADANDEASCETTWARLDAQDSIAHVCY